MKFVLTDSGDFIAVDTIARISNVEKIQVVVNKELGRRETQSRVRYQILTKRGETHIVTTSQHEFAELISGV